MSGRIGGRIVDNGLILHLNAGNANSYMSGSTIWNDLSNNHAILTATGNTSFTTGNLGGVVFDSTNEAFISNLIIQPSNALTISCWFRALGTPTPNDTFGGGLIISTSQASPTGYYLGYSWTDQKVSFGTLVNDFIVSPVGSVLQNTIYNVTAVQTGSQQLIYINGEFVTSRAYSTIPTYPVSGDRLLRVGNWTGSFVRNFNGAIYQMLLYDRALSASESKQNFLALKGRFGV